MKKERISKVARFATTDEVQKWASTVGRFSADVQAAVAPLVKAACDGCPFRKIVVVGGCLSDDCPIRLAMRAVQLASPRAAAATKEIYKAKFNK